MTCLRCKHCEAKLFGFYRRKTATSGNTKSEHYPSFGRSRAVDESGVNVAEQYAHPALAQVSLP